MIYQKEHRIKGTKLIREIRKEFTDLVEMLLSTPNIDQRLKGIGRLEPEIARNF